LKNQCVAPYRIPEGFNRLLDVDLFRNSLLLSMDRDEATVRDGAMESDCVDGYLACFGCTVTIDFPSPSHRIEPDPRQSIMT
jgi:hypothetical protein